MSRHRTAGGLAAESSRMARLRSTASIGSFRSNNGNAATNGGGANGSSSGYAAGVHGKKGVFVDADGRTHDQEYDPFARHAAESRKKSMSSRRKSAFGSAHGHSSINGNGNGQDDTGSETSRSDSDYSEGAVSGRYSAGMGQGLGPARKSIDSSRTGDREEEEIRRRLALERKRLEGLSGYNALAKRRSIISERSSAHHGNGYDLGSIRSEEADRFTVHSGISGGTSRRAQQMGYNPSPLSPTFSAGTGRARTDTISDGGEETPVKSTENTLMPPMSPPQPVSPGLSDRRGSTERIEKPYTQSGFSIKSKPAPLPDVAVAPKAKVEIKRDGSRKVTGFDAPRSPMPPPPLPTPPSIANRQLDVPASAMSGASRGSRGSSERDSREVVGGDDQSIYSTNTANPMTSAASARYRRERPAPRPREEIFPETPAQAKRREEKERRAAARAGPSLASGATSTVIRSSSGMHAPSAAQAYATSSHANAARNHSSLAIDTSLAASTRLLPEIQIVEDDDPRVGFPSSGGRSTRVQTVHDHVIRGPFSHALNAQGVAASGIRRESGAGAGIGLGSPTASRGGSRAGSPGPSISLSMAQAGASARKPSSINSPFSVGSASGTVEDRIGYLPSRWANGDKNLRMTEEEREMYRPKEWGGRNGELGGRPDEWQYVFSRYDLRGRSWSSRRGDSVIRARTPGSWQTKTLYMKQMR